MLGFIYERHSVRKFKDEDIPIEDIKEIIKAATYAPSGKNEQNWHFIVVKNKQKLETISQIIENKGKELAQYTKDEKKKNQFLSQIKHHTFFKEAPATVFLFAGPYAVTGFDLFLESNPSKEEIKRFIDHDPQIQNIGSCMENLLLAAANMGYGGCWMTGPMYAKNEIKEYLNLDKKDYQLVCMTPLGVPEESELNSPPRKPLEEVLTIIN